MIATTKDETRPDAGAESKAVPKDDRRIQRISLPLPVRVEVKIDRSSNWNEITRLTDISAFGAGFTLKRPAKRGRVVQLTIPMPRQLRCYDYGEAQYKVWSLVRRCIEVENRNQENTFAVGVAFLGKTPPEGFFEHPSRLYDISHREAQGEGLWQVVESDLTADDSDLPSDLRKQSRFHIPEALILELMDADGSVSASESTVTENISVGGAAVFTQFDVEPGTFFRVTSERHDVKIISVVRARRLGPDGMTRLHLEFIDRLFPLQGVE
ncbi:MAG: PilZ domain-containing protein [Acidobacteriota bacterium]